MQYAYCTALLKNKCHQEYYLSGKETVHDFRVLPHARLKRWAALSRQVKRRSRGPPDFSLNISNGNFNTQLRVKRRFL